MRAAVFHQLKQPLTVETVPDPTPGEGQVVVEVCRCGICGSDLHLTADALFGVPAGAVLGHEYAGRIAAIGRGVDRVKVGDHVAMMPLHSCGTCLHCLRGEPAWCSIMRVDGGGYGEYALARQHQCVPLPRTVSLEDGALVEPMAVGLHGVRLAQSQPGDRVLVLGAGPIGLASIYWARRLGADALRRRQVRRDVQNWHWPWARMYSSIRPMPHLKRPFVRWVDRRMSSTNAWVCPA